MSVDELAVMPSSRCIVQVQGVRPFYSKKYDLTKHPQYKYTADANPKFAFDVKAYLQHRLKVKPEEEFEVYDLGEIKQHPAAAYRLHRCPLRALKSVGLFLFTKNSRIPAIHYTGGQNGIL